MGRQQSACRIRHSVFDLAKRRAGGKGSTNPQCAFRIPQWDAKGGDVGSTRKNTVHGNASPLRAARKIPREPRPVSAVVLAAGLGTRMNSDRAKVLHHLGGQPLIAYPDRRTYWL